MQPEPKYPATLREALLAFQADPPKVEKRKTERVPGRPPRPYAGLDDVVDATRPALAAVGLTFSAKPTLNAGGVFVLAYKLEHVSGEKDEGEYPLGAVGSQQTMGSAITYGRRYCLQSITNLVAEEDDDGAAASQPQPQARRGRGGRNGGVPAYDQPTSDEEWPETAQPAQRKAPGNRHAAMMAEFSRMKLPDGSSLADEANRAARIDGINKVIGPDRKVASSNDLTAAEVERVITSLKNRSV